MNGLRVHVLMRSRWTWAVVIALFVLAAPAASFFSNQRSKPPVPARGSSSPAEDLSFGAPTTFEPLFTLSVDGPQGVATSPKETGGGPTPARAGLTLDVVTSDREGRTWVVDHPASTSPRARVRVFDPRGRLLSTFTTPPGATLFTPGVRDDLWFDIPAGEDGRETVERYSTRGKRLGRYPLPRGYLARYLRLDPDGGLYAYQEQWSIDPQTERNRYGGTLLPVAHPPEYEPVSAPKGFDAMFFGADERMYVAQASFAYRKGEKHRFELRAVDRAGSVTATYRLPDGAVPIGADRDGRVYAEVPPSGTDEQPGVAILGDVQHEDCTVYVVDRDGSVSRFFAKRPPWIGGWPSSVWVAPGGDVGGLSFGSDGLTVGRILLGERPEDSARPRPFTPQLRLISASEPPSGDPYAARDARERDLMQLVHAGLVSVDARLRVRPALAVSVPKQRDGGVSKDGRVITYTIRAGARWHDGKEVTGEDVVATWRYLRVRRTEARRAPFPGFDRIRSVEARGDVVRVFLDTPFGAGPEAFFPFVLPAHLLERYGTSSTSQLWARPVGAGPYRLERWVERDSWQLTVHDTGVQQKAAIARLEVRFLDGDEALTTYQSAPVPTVWTHVDAKGADAVRRDKVGDAITAETGRWRGILFDPTDPSIDSETRRALVRAYPRAAMARDILPASTTTDAVDVFPRISASHQPRSMPPSSDDTLTARALLDSARWALDEDGLLSRGGVRLEVPLAVGRRGGTDESSFEAVSKVTGQWRSLGVLSYRSMSTPRLYDGWFDSGLLANASYRAAYGVFQGVPDPGQGGVFDAGERPGPTRPRGIGVAPVPGEIARLYDKARATYDSDERAAIGRRISELVREQDRCIFERYETRDLAVLGVRGVRPAPYPAGDLWNVAEWRIER